MPNNAAAEQLLLCTLAHHIMDAALRDDPDEVARLLAQCTDRQVLRLWVAVACLQYHIAREARTRTEENTP